MARTIKLWQSCIVKVRLEKMFASTHHSILEKLLIIEDIAKENNTTYIEVKGLQGSK